MEVKHIIHEKYGYIENPSWTSIEDCFKSWNVIDEDEDEDIGYGVIDELRKISKDSLTIFLKKYNVPGKNQNDEDIHRRSKSAWQDCFGKHYKYYDINSLSIDELIYFILQCENYGLLKQPSIWKILPKLAYDH